MDRGLIRLLCFLFALILLAEVALYPILADAIARGVFGYQDGLEAPIVVYQFLYVLPVSVAFGVAMVMALVKGGDHSKKRGWTVVAAALVANLGLLILSVALYLRS